MPGDGLGVLDGAPHDHANRGRKRHHAKVDDFIGLRLGWAGAQATRQKRFMVSARKPGLA